MRAACCLLLLACVLLVAPRSVRAGGEIGLTDEGLIDVSPLRGQVVIVDFWASWCVPCRKSLPWLSQLQRQYADRGLTVVSVSVDSNSEAADEFRKRYGGADLALLSDPEGKAAAAYQLQGMPSMYVYDRDGSLAFSHVGFRDRDRTGLERRIAALVDMEVGLR